MTSNAVRLSFKSRWAVALPSSNNISAYSTRSAYIRVFAFVLIHTSIEGISDKAFGTFTCIISWSIMAKSICSTSFGIRTFVNICPGKCVSEGGLQSIRENLPRHWTSPSPVKPSLHLQRKWAGRLQHQAFSTHLEAIPGSSHSLISEMDCLA